MKKMIDQSLSLRRDSRDGLLSSRFNLGRQTAVIYCFRADG